jgi:hypothetical protein
MKRPKFGDVVEIRTAKGLAYAQYTHKHKMMGSLLRVFKGFYDSRPADFFGIVNSPPMFMCFFPLGAAVNRKIVEIAANEMIPEEAQAFPLFRSPGGIDRSGRVVNWWLWDGEKEWYIGEKLTAEQRKLSIRGAWTDIYLIDKIESGWTPETDTRG